MAIEMNTATHQIATNYTALAEDVPEFPIGRGLCSFCPRKGACVETADLINRKYFSNADLMRADTGWACVSCAYCMTQRELKQGHWIATQDSYERVSTGDLPELFAAIRADEYDPPLSLHISENPIRSEHAYLWTPVMQTTDKLLCDYSGQTVRCEWDTLDELVQLVEDCRWHGMRIDDIRQGTPRIADLESMGGESYRAADDVLREYRGTPELELALTLSKAAKDQDRD